jgi:hypothetical protein
VVLAEGRRLGGPVGVEQAELALLPQHAHECAVDQRGVHLAGGDRAREGFAVAVDGRQLDVDAGAEGERGRVGRSGRHAVQRLQEGDREVVGDHRAGEAPRRPQQVGEQAVIGRHGHAVEVGVGVHHRTGAGADRHLERGEEHVGQLPGPDAHRCEIASRP